MLFTHGSGLRSFIAYRFRNERIKTVACEFILTAESLADDGVANILSGKHDGYPDDIFANDLLWRFQVQQVAGVLNLIGLVRHDGTDNVEFLYEIALNTRYLLEVEWALRDSPLSSTWEVWINEVSVDSGTITGNPLNYPWELTDVQPGGAAVDTAAATHVMGPLLVYDTVRDARRWRNVFQGRSFLHPLTDHGRSRR